MILQKGLGYVMNYTEDTKLNLSQERNLAAFIMNANSLPDFVKEGKDARLVIVAKKNQISSFWSAESRITMMFRIRPKDESIYYLSPRTEIVASGESLVQVVNNNSLYMPPYKKNLCLDPEICSCEIVLATSQIHELTLAAYFEKYQLDVKVNHSFTRYDEISDDKNPVTYNLTTSDRSDWDFSFEVLSGIPEFYLHAGHQKPKKLSDYNFGHRKITSKLKLGISQAECKVVGSDCKNVFLTVRSELGSRFRLNTTVRPQKSLIFLEMNELFSGKIGPAEILNFAIKLDPKISERFKGFIDLLSNVGNTDLYVMDCEDIKKC